MMPTTLPQVSPALAIAGLTRLSTCDWPGHLVATVFLQGCPWHCGYCHNPELLDSTVSGQVPWQDVRKHLERRRGLLDGVVFSGGEPTRQPELAVAVGQVRELGFAVGLHTAGAFPRTLARVLPMIDWVGLDIKALPCAYAEVTGVRGSAAMAYESLRLVLLSGVAHEVRVTVDPRVHDAVHIGHLVAGLQGLGVQHIALQEMRAMGMGPDQAGRLDHPSFEEIVRGVPDDVELRENNAA